MALLRHAHHFFLEVKALLYKIGTERELLAIEGKLPKQVYGDLYTGIVVLDAEYGAERDYLQLGGYSLIVETEEDLAELKAIIDYETHPCEWAVREARNCGYLNALYIVNDDFSIMVYMPIAIAPDAILNDVED